jgi:hypothetical protein
VTGHWIGIWPVGSPAPVFSLFLTMTFEPVSGKARASLETMAGALKITASERLQLAEMIRKRDVPMSRDGAIPLDALVTLVRELRGER